MIEPQEDIAETNRLEAFSDGVFAVAITLLVLEIRLPASADPTVSGTLLGQLLDLLPTYLAYVTSFVTIGIMWANHHAMFRMIRHTDRSFLILNALLLMIVTFFNFPTVIVARYFQQPDGNVAAMFYSGTLFLIGILFNLMWWYAARNNHLIDPDFDRAKIPALTRQYGLGTLLYLIAFGMAFVSAAASVMMCLLLAVFFALPIRRRR